MPLLKIYDDLKVLKSEVSEWKWNLSLSTELSGIGPHQMTHSFTQLSLFLIFLSPAKYPCSILNSFKCVLAFFGPG